MFYPKINVKPQKRCLGYGGMGEDMGSLLSQKSLWLAWKRLEWMQGNQLGGFCRGPGER